jgi:hypothetical protein
MRHQAHHDLAITIIGRFETLTCGLKDGSTQKRQDEEQ